MIHVAGRVRETCADVISFKVGKLCENLSVRHIIRQKFKNVDYANPHSADAGTAAALGRVYSDAV
jgi:hypothetical protein